MIALKKYFLSEKEREQYEEKLLEAYPQFMEKIYHLDDEELLEQYKRLEHS
ncbi:hypothetical protein [Bacillus alveayuensis]|uniref:hypothetical protein n=1 Tax=Aeribacillus alveayuensis TaxID=279215 RepID=UPI000ADBFDC6|nr:hypothetical protein [Bacillus alveayuensis]